MERVEVTAVTRPPSELGEEGGLVLEMDMEEMEEMGGMGGEQLEVVTLLEGEEGLLQDGDAPDSVYYVISA